MAMFQTTLYSMKAGYLRKRVWRNCQEIRNVTIMHRDTSTPGALSAEIEAISSHTFGPTTWITCEFVPGL